MPGRPVAAGHGPQPDRRELPGTVRRGGVGPSSARAGGAPVRRLADRVPAAGRCRHVTSGARQPAASTSGRSGAPTGPSRTATARPSSSTTTRSAIASTAGSWVTITAVAPSARITARRRREELLGRRGVELAGRLVGQEDRWADGERRRDGDPLLLAAGQLAEAGAAAMAEPDGPQQLVRPAASCCGAHPAEGERQGHDLRHGEVWRERAPVVLVHGRDDRPPVMAEELPVSPAPWRRRGWRACPPSGDPCRPAGEGASSSPTPTARPPPRSRRRQPGGPGRAARRRRRRPAVPPPGVDAIKPRASISAVTPDPSSVPAPGRRARRQWRRGRPPRPSAPQRRPPARRAARPGRAAARDASRRRRRPRRP